MLKNWCFWIVVLEKTLESPLDSKEIKPVNPKRKSTLKSSEGLMPKLKCQYFGHLMWTASSLENIQLLGKIKGKRKSGQQRMRWSDSITDSTWIWANSGRWWRTGKPGMLQSMGSQRLGYNLANWVCLATEQQQQQILSQETKRNKLPWCKSCMAKNCGLYLFVESSCWLRCSKKTDFSHIVTRKLLLPTTWMNLEADSFLFQPPDEDTTWPTSWSVALYDETEDLLKPTRLLTCDKWELLNVCWLML